MRDGAGRTLGAVAPVLFGAGRALAGVAGREGVTRRVGAASGRVRTFGGVARPTRRVGAGVTTTGRRLPGREAVPGSSRFVSGREVRTGEPGVITSPPDRVRGIRGCGGVEVDAP